MVKILADDERCKVGMEFGRLTVIGRRFVIRESNGRGASRVVLECKCGKFTVVRMNSLLRKITESCGCFHSEVCGEILRQQSTTHGMSYTPLYKCWQGMISRCIKPTGPHAKRYHDRGITVCQEWMESTEAFMSWAMSHGYEPGLEIDRRDNNGNYEPENCRFVTPLVNMSNRENTRFAIAFGETKTVADWSRDSRCSITRGCLNLRLKIGKMSPEDAITRPKMKGN
jgi:hypothetical protein